MKKLLILVIVLVAAYFALDKFYPQILQKIPAVKQETQQSILDETSNWKSYRNEQYGFEFMYPKIMDKKNGSHFYLEDFVFLDDKGGALRLRIVNEELRKNNIKSLIGGMVSPDFIKEKIVDKKIAYHFNEGDAGCGGSDYRIPLNDMRHLSFRFVDCELNEPYIKSYEESIISTFKFIQ